MKKIITSLVIACMAIGLFAQSKERPHLTPEEFKSKQQAFITEKAKLSKDEAAKFFPVFFELQDKKRELNDKVWKLFKEGKDNKTSEDRYDEIISQTIELRIKGDQLEKEYLKKFRKILSAKKVYNVQFAEMRFHRELLKDVNRHRHQERKER